MNPVSDIFGKQVNRTSRLLGVAKPKQIVVSDSIEDNAHWQLKILDFSLGPDLFKTVQMPTGG